MYSEKLQNETIRTVYTQFETPLYSDFSMFTLEKLVLHWKSPLKSDKL